MFSSHCFAVPIPSDLKALQKEVLTNASALNEVITSTKAFLEENRSKLTPDQIASIESKLEEAKSKDKLINQRAEESRKDLEKVVTTAIKQESEKVRVQSVKQCNSNIAELNVNILYLLSICHFRQQLLSDLKKVRTKLKDSWTGYPT